MTPIRRIALVAVGSLAALSALQTPATAAPVGTLGDCSSWWEPCGEVQNDTSGSGSAWIRVSLNWVCDSYKEPVGTGCATDVQTVAPGGHAGGGDVDVDAFEVPENCTYWGDVNGVPFVYYSGWYRFSSTETATVNHSECTGV